MASGLVKCIELMASCLEVHGCCMSPNAILDLV